MLTGPLPILGDVLVGASAAAAWLPVAIGDHDARSATARARAGHAGSAGLGTASTAGESAARGRDGLRGVLLGIDQQPECQPW